MNAVNAALLHVHHLLDGGDAPLSDGDAVGRALQSVAVLAELVRAQGAAIDALVDVVDERLNEAAESPVGLWRQRRRQPERGARATRRVTVALMHKRNDALDTVRTQLQDAVGDELATSCASLPFDIAVDWFPLVLDDAVDNGEHAAITVQLAVLLVRLDVSRTQPAAIIAAVESARRTVDAPLLLVTSKPCNRAEPAADDVALETYALAELRATNDAEALPLVTSFHNVGEARTFPSDAAVNAAAVKVVVGQIVMICAQY